MNKSVISILALVVVAVLMIGVRFAYLAVSGSAPEKTTKDSITELIVKKYDLPVNSVNIEVVTDTGMYAKGTVHYSDPDGGGVWFAAKSQKGWELAFEGNGIVSCFIANGYNFPTDMIPQCIDTKNENNLVAR